MTVAAVSFQNLPMVAVSDAVVQILSLRPVTQIAQSVVLGVVIPMQAIHAQWAWAHESSQHNLMNKHVTTASELNR